LHFVFASFWLLIFEIFEFFLCLPFRELSLDLRILEGGAGAASGLPAIDGDG